MKVLITGGAGYLGSTLTPLLLSQGYDVRVLDNLSCGGSSMLGFWCHPNFEFLRGDLRREGDVRAAVAGADAVVHLAAIVGDSACARNREEAMAVNREGSIRLIEASQEAKVDRFLFASTCSNYGKMGDAAELVNEVSELHPVSLYADTKVAVEQHVMGSDPADLCAVSMRFSTLFGVSPRMRFDLTVNQFTAELATRRALKIFGEQFWRPYVHVHDAARAIDHILRAERGSVAGQVFNIGDTAENYRKSQIVDLIKEQLAFEPMIERVRQESDPRDYRVSFEKIRTALGYRITRTVPDGIREVLSLLREGVITDFADPAYSN